MNQKRKEIIHNNAISRLVCYNLVGYDQKVVLDGKTADLPLALFLHGGPGSPLPFNAGCRGLFPAFTDRFIMVYWDQLGCGINNHKLDDHFSIATFTQMAVDLLGHLRAEFPANKILLLGVSWGSVLACQAATQAPELIERVVTYGQVVRDLFFNPHTIRALEQANLPVKIQKQLAQLQQKPTHDKEDTLQLAGWLNKYVGDRPADPGGVISPGQLLRGLFTSPDYTFKDCIAIFKNGAQQNNSLFHELLQVDLTQQLASLTVPYHIVQGSADLTTPTPIVQDFFQRNSNPNLTLQIVPGEAHLPGTSGIAAILEQLQQ